MVPSGPLIYASTCPEYTPGCGEPDPAHLAAPSVPDGSKRLWVQTHPGPGSQLRVPPLAPPPPPIWPLASEDLAVFALDRLFSGT